MIDYFKDLWARLQVHWRAVAVALIAALPSILDWLGVVDLKPLLMQVGVKEGIANFVVGVMPFVLAFLRPMIALAPADTAETE